MRPRQSCGMERCAERCWHCGGCCAAILWAGVGWIRYRKPSSVAALIMPVVDRMNEGDGSGRQTTRSPGPRELVGKLRATAQPEAHRKVKHRLAAAAAQIGFPGKPVFGLLGRGILP